MERKKTDRRIKLSDLEKTAILAEYNSGITNKAFLGRKYGVSDQMVTYIVQPGKLAENRKNTVKNNEKNRLRVQEFRKRQKQQNEK
jgi:hypothetical protein